MNFPQTNRIRSRLNKLGLRKLGPRNVGPGKSGARLLAGCLPLLLLQGCFLFPPRPLTELSGLKPVKPDVAQALLQQVNENSGSIKTFQAMGSLSVRRSVIKQKLSEVIVFERPDKLRVELFASEFNRLTAFLIVAGETLEARDLTAQKTYAGQATRQNMSRLLKLPFTPEEMMLWTTGRYVVQAEELAAYRALSDERGSHKVLELNYVDGRQVLIATSQADGRPACAQICIDSLEVRSQAEKKTAFFSSYTWQAGKNNSIPHSISFEFPELSLKGELKFRDITLNEDLGERKEKLFAIQSGDAPNTVNLDAVKIDPALF